VALTRGYVLAVNAGSDSVSVLRVVRSGLRLVDTAGSGGDRPVSVAAHGRLVYVLNAGGRGSISGLRLRDDGRLVRIRGSRRRLSGADNPGATQVGFSPNGRLLVVTERFADVIDVYGVRRDGRVTPPVTRRSSGPEPFGFAFDPLGRLIVSEAFDSMPDASAVSSYEPRGRRLNRLSGSVRTTETSACWMAVTPDGRFAYSTNTPSGSISGFRIGRSGRLRRLDADGRTAVIPSGRPTDVVVSRGGRLLHALDPATRSVATFRVGRDGALTAAGQASGLPEFAAGLTGG
jgi:6-phosphogluconolactonase (cycloisomerase 2 family)